ncbi:MAG: efflux RND transporter permease subunit, partial [Candidatus Nanoarchaeia archaeon]
MFLSDFSTKRPIAMTALLIALALAGFNAFRKIGIDNMPELDIPYITVTTIYPGASPREIELDIAKKIEDAVSTIDGLKHVHSTCIENMCLTLLEFELSVDVDIAATDVREKLDLIKNELPEDAESPKILKFDPNSKPVATILLTGSLPLDQIYDFADEILSDRFSTIEGVAEVQITGGEKLELQVSINRKRLAAVGLTTYDVVEKLLANNIKIPSGTIKDGKSEISVSFDSEFKTINEISELEIGKNGNGRTYLKDVAKIELTSKEKRTLAFYCNKPAINMKIIKKGGANAVKVVNKIKKVMEEIKASKILPGSLEMTLFSDDAGFIEASMNDAWGSVITGILLTSAILFMFLHEIRSTIIVAISMPISVLISFFVMPFFNYTFNNSTLLAFGTSVGVLVTNSIVVIENIFRKLASGLQPRPAAAEGTSEVALPVFASASTNVVVFIPIALMSSIVGRYFTPFAVVMTAATLVSLFISFTLTPILSAILLRNKMPQHKNFLKIYVRIFEYFYETAEKKYSDSLVFCKKHPLLFYSLIFAIFAGTFVLIAPNVGFSFFPDNDRGEFIIKLEYPTYYNIDETTK